jgi:prepilin-type N-terminal cleavage/methylation domain-containing protein
MLKKNGFTTLELMVAIGIVCILTAITVPTYIKWLPGYRLRSAANDMHVAIQMARLKAVKENGRTGVSYSDGSGKSGKYRVFLDTNNSNTFDNNDDVVKYGEMPGGVRLNASMSRKIFDARGLAIAGAGTVTLSSDPGGTKTISLSTTGNIRIN